MTDAVLTRVRALLRASWQGQLLVLAGAAVLLALPMLGSSTVGADTLPRLAVTLVVLVLAVAMSVRVAVRGERGYETEASDLPGDVLLLLPRLVVHAALVIAPFVLVWWLATAVSAAMGVLGLVAVPLACAVSLLAPPLLVLTVVAVASGDPAWTPASAVRIARRRRGAGMAVAWLLLLCAIVASLPVGLVAFVVAAQVPHAGFVAMGAGGAAMIPILGCGALALWRELGGTEVVVEAVSERSGPFDPHAVNAMVLAGPVADAWADGPAWDFALEAGTSWGTWLRLSVATRAAVRVVWTGADAPPGLALSGTEGVWWRPGDPTASGAAVAVDLPAGDTYLQVDSRAVGGAQAVSVVLMLPASAVA